MNNKIFWSFFIAFVLTAQLTFADGGFFPRHDFSDIYEPEQTAIIIFEEGKQKLYLWVSYEGTTDEFSWVIPVPGLPELEEATLKPFYKLSYISQPEEAELFNFLSVFLLGGFGDARGFSGVEIISEEQIGVYDATILSAEDPEALTNWLRENDYSIREGAEEIFEYYTNKNWYYIALKISPERYSGNLHPILLEFETEKPVYPLKITSLNPGSTKIALYVISSERMRPDNRRLNLEYASNISGEMLDRAHNIIVYSIRDIDPHIRDTILTDRASLKPLPENAQITKYSGTLSQRHMNEDITFEPAKIRDYTKKEYSSKFFWSIIFLIIAPFFLVPLTIIPFFALILLISLIYNQVPIIKKNTLYKMKVSNVLAYAAIIPIIAQWILGVLIFFKEPTSIVIFTATTVILSILLLAALHHKLIRRRLKKKRKQK